MLDNLYEQAIKLIEDDNIECAIPLLEKSLNNGNFKSAYELALLHLDCYEDLGFKTIQYDTAIYYLKIGAINGNNDCQVELSEIFLDDSGFFTDLNEGLRWLLISDKKLHSKNYNKAFKIVSKIKNRINSKNYDEHFRSMDLFKEYYDLTNNKDFKILLLNTIKDLVVTGCNSFLGQCNDLDLLNSKEDLFMKYKENKYFDVVFISFLRKYVKLNLENCNSLIFAESIINYVLENTKNIFYISDEIVNNILSDVYLWIARGYRFAKYGIEYNPNKSIKYYEKVNSYDSRNERENVMYEYCNGMIEKGELNIAINYIKLLFSESKQKELYEKIRKINEKKEFTDLCNKICDFDEYLYDLLATYYEKGYGTEPNINKSLDLHREILKKSKNRYYIIKSFNYIYNYYFLNDYYSENFSNLLKYGRNRGIPFNDEQQKHYESIVNYYASNNYEFVKYVDFSESNYKDNYIYWIEKYYQEWWTYNLTNNYKKNYYINNSYDEFIQIKKYERNNKYKKKNYFINNELVIYDSLLIESKLKEILKKLNENWLICFVPGHEKSDVGNYDNTGVMYMVKKAFGENEKRFTYEKHLLLRKFTIEAKHKSDNRIIDYRIDLKSLSYNTKINIKNKNIIIFDDITTTGTSLIACRYLLLKNGANKVFCIALGRTVGKGEQYEF